MSDMDEDLEGEESDREITLDLEEPAVVVYMNRAGISPSEFPRIEKAVAEITGSTNVIVTCNGQMLARSLDAKLLDDDVYDFRKNLRELNEDGSPKHIPVINLSVADAIFLHEKYEKHADGFTPVLDLRFVEQVRYNGADFSIDVKFSNDAQRNWDDTVARICRDFTDIDPDDTTGEVWNNYVHGEMIENLELVDVLLLLFGPKPDQRVLDFFRKGDLKLQGVFSYPVDEIDLILNGMVEELFTDAATFAQRVAEDDDQLIKDLDNHFAIEIYTGTDS